MKMERIEKEIKGTNEKGAIMFNNQMEGKMEKQNQLRAAKRLAMRTQYIDLSGNVVKEIVETYKVWDKNRDFAYNVAPKSQDFLHWEDGDWYWYRDRWTYKKGDWVRTHYTKKWEELEDPRYLWSKRIEKGTIVRTLEVLE